MLFAGVISGMLSLAVVGYVLWLGNQRIALLVEKLHLLDKNEQLKQLAENAAYNLREPIAQTVTVADMLVDDQGTHRNNNTMLLKILRQISEEMLRRVTNILEYVQLNKKAIDKTDINMRQLVSVVVYEQKQQFGSDHSIIVGDMPDAHVDENLFRLVWMNLIENAIKFSKPDSSAQILIHGWQKKHDVVYAIKDKGVGIPPAKADTIFGLTDKTDDQGIGLALIRAITERHGGTFYVDTNYTEGTCFILKLPVPDS